MRILRQCLAFVLSSVLVFPAFGKSNAIGQAVYSESATVRDSSLETGSSLFNDDVVSVGDKGIARIAFAGGGQVEVFDGSAVRFARNGPVVQFFMVAGSASFRSEPGSEVETLIADATIRSAQGLATAGLIRLESPDSAVVVARKGTLEITTLHDPKAVLVAEGSAARITLVPDPEPQQQGGAVPAGKSTPLGSPSEKKLALIALLIGGGLLITGIILATREKPKEENVIINEVSPFTIK